MGPSEGQHEETPMNRAFASGLRAACVSLALMVATPTPGVAQTEYTNQNSSTTFYHSGIVTSTGVVWDTDFANIVSNAVGTNYNEIAFAFMQCYGGGMIDELLNKNLVFANYTSASRWDQTSWSFDNARQGIVANYESTYNIPYAPAAGGGPVTFTLQQAAVTARNNDMFGPVQNLGPVLYPGGVGGKPVVENPQYTSSGAIGDSITLHRNNPNNPTANTKYLAIVFGGLAGATNTNSVTRISNALTARGYAGGEVRNVAPGATAAQLQAAWTFVKNNTTPTTQIFYWNAPQHGSLSFDFIGFIKNLLGGLPPVKGVTYNFGLTGSFVTDVLQHASNVLSLGDSNPLDAPYVEVQSASPNDGISLLLNGHSLAEVGSPFDLYGDGSEYDYRFALSSGDLALLSTSDTVALNWTGGATPAFGLGEINVGNLGNFVIPATVPEPTSCLMLLIGVGAVGGAMVVRQRARDRQGLL
jgi:hypothetical protein